MQKIVATLTAHHRFYAPWEYRVVERVGERYHLQPVRVSSGMPTLRNVRARPGVAGACGYASLGSCVLVAFVDGSPARPVVVAFDDAESPGFDTTLVRFGTADAADPLARKSDLQTAVDSIRSWANGHVHATAGTGPPVIPTVLLVGPTATGSSIAKVSG